MSVGRDPEYLILESISNRIDDIVFDLREVKHDLKEAKGTIEKDVTSLKLEQNRCNSYWGAIGKTLGWSGFLGTFSFLASKFFNPHDPN